MVFGELPTVFPWYDDIRKQNRFRKNAEWSCPFRLITPRDAMLPFQIKIPYRTNEDKSIFDKNNPNNFVVNSKMEANGTFVSNPNYQRTIFLPIEGGGSLFITTREVISDLISFYDASKIFIQSITANTLLDRQFLVPANARYIVANFSKNKDTRASDLLFFSLTKTQSDSVTPGEILSWKIYTESGLEVNIDNGTNKYKLHQRSYVDGLRLYYYGEKLFFTRPGISPLAELNLEPGAYYSVIEFENAVYYSEIFNVPNNRFRISEPNEFMRVDFWNNSDIAPVMYAPNDGDIWKQYVYIDAYVYASDPEIEVDGERDENDMIIPTFQRLVTKYRFSSLVPDYLKIALVSIQMHDNIEITTENNVRKGKVDRMSSTTAIEGDGAYSSVDIVFDQYVMVKRSCKKNMRPFTFESQ